MILNDNYFDCFADTVVDYARPYKAWAGGMIFPVKVEHISGLAEYLEGLDYEILFFYFKQVKNFGHGRWYHPHLYLRYKNGNMQLLSAGDCLLSDEEYDTFGVVEEDRWQATYQKYA